LAVSEHWRTGPKNLDKLDFWKLCEELSVVQAALIICGVTPESHQWRVEDLSEDKRPNGYTPIRTAITHALEAGHLNAVVHAYQWDEATGEQTRYIDPHGTKIAVSEIDRFLRSKNFHCPFFERDADFAQGADMAKDMPPKLAAALKSWLAVTSDPARVRGKSPKQALRQWLIEHAAEFGLLGRDGRVNETGIAEVCKVANWKPGGGATPTPVGAAQAMTSSRPMIRLPVAPTTPGRYDTWQATMDDEIPF
jgi:hypothetical protein